MLSVGQADENFGRFDHGVISRDGRFIFLAANDSTIRVLERNQTTGEFTQLASVPTGGGAPTRLALAPDQTSLYFLSEASNYLGRFSLDHQSGAAHPA